MPHHTITGTREYPHEAFSHGHVRGQRLHVRHVGPGRGLAHSLEAQARRGLARVLAQSRQRQTDYPSRLTEIKLTVYADEVRNDMVSISDGSEDWINAAVNFDEFDHFKCARERCAELGMQPKYSASHRGMEANRAIAYYPDGPLGNLEDHDTWIAQGLITAYVIGHNCRGELDVLETVPDQIQMAKVRLGSPMPFALQVETYSNREGIAGDWLDRLIALAEKENIDELILREATPMWPHRSMWRALGQRFGAPS